MSEILWVPHQEVARLVTSAFEHAGIPSADAGTIAEILVMADLQGIETHGIRRVAPYIARIHDGVFNPTPDIRVERTATAVAIVDGDDGLGPVIGVRGLLNAIEIAKECGVAYVSCRNSQHFGALAPYALRAAEAGVVCFLGTNAFATMAPTGGREVRLGNNPFGLGAPRRDAPPFILDIAMSVVARGKIRQSQERGEAIPLGWALDPAGVPTTNPLEALKGFVQPIGNHKGYGLALMVDILAGVLSGGAVGTEVKSMFQQTSEAQRVSHFFIAIDPSRILGIDAYYERMETLCRLMTSTPPFDAASPVMIPGEIEARTYAERHLGGIPMRPKELAALQALAAGQTPNEVARY